ncbi:FG-GAP-like repeat-containing protein [Hymenobacter negativus]|uniref:VCBS repeat-containing protein n=1 Tax=Hymenobacter negativus TaxID=2795026 RepID=A0ABS0QAG9_9BACT|nr:FG-GAP-like repeat-containing protein [Hymenobacter negativus]MBH8559684.1 VCBS repeat-containing protein [Hymenobacter negativus]
MTNFYSLPRWTLRTGLLLAPAGVALAQAPVITSVIPMANARAAARSGPVTVNFNQPLTAASAGSLKVFSAQQGGLRSRGATPAVASGSTLSFAPTAYDFRPGETVQYTVTTAAAGSGGALAQGRVGQFTAAVGGTGRGYFQPGNEPAVGGMPAFMTAADVNSDGALDLLLCNMGSAAAPGSTVSIRLNMGNGTYSGTLNVPVGNMPSGINTGDVDGDGDIDFVVANQLSNTVSVRLNDGSGGFTGGQEIAVGPAPYSVTLGDVDGDGDLDLLVPNSGANSGTTTGSGTVSLCLNAGNGTFGGGQNVPSGGFSPCNVVAADVDNDGDLDLLIENYGGNNVSVRLNNGTGSFSGTQNVAVGSIPLSMVAGDVDGDGDVDLLTANFYGNTVSVRLNDGSGIFSGSQEVSVAGGPLGMALGDVDSDGDLDLLVPIATTTPYSPNNPVSLRLNNGSGIFGGSQEMAVRGIHSFITIGDVDSDGDLDFITDNGTNTVSVYLNGATALATSNGLPTLQLLTLYPNPAYGAVALTGAAPNAPLTVLDALGRVLLTATADAAGAARLVLPEGLPAGVYLVRSGGKVRRLTVE